MQNYCFHKTSLIIPISNFICSFLIDFEFISQHIWFRWVLLKTRCSKQNGSIDNLFEFSNWINIIQDGITAPKLTQAKYHIERKWKTIVLIEQCIPNKVLTWYVKIQYNTIQSNTAERTQLQHISRNVKHIISDALCDRISFIFVSIEATIKGL